jgi:hypothetical protein
MPVSTYEHPDVESAVLQTSEPVSLDRNPALGSKHKLPSRKYHTLIQSTPDKI